MRGGRETPRRPRRASPTALSRPSALLLAFVLLLCAPAHAHQGAVGVVQAKLDPEGVTVLLKFKAAPLLETVFPRTPGAALDALTTPEGRNKVLDLLVETHSVTTPQAICERDAIELFQPAPSGKWFDIIIKYRCPGPYEEVRIKVETLLTEKDHRLMGTFEAAGELTRTVLTRRRPTFTFKLGPTPPQPEPKVDPPAEAPEHRLEADLLSLIAHGDLILFPLILLTAAGPRRMRAGGAAVGLFAALCTALWGHALGLDAATFAGLAGLLGVGALLVRHHLMNTDLDRQDLLLVGLVGACIGVAASRAGGLALRGDLAVGLVTHGLVIALGLIAGAWLGERDSPRIRRAIGWVGVAVVIFLAIGEVAMVG